MAALLERLKAATGEIASASVAARLLDVRTIMAISPTELRQAGDVASKMQRAGHGERAVRTVLKMLFSGGSVCGGEWAEAALCGRGSGWLVRRVPCASCV